MLHRSRLLRSRTASMTATEIMTTITLAARLASSACRAQKSPSRRSETIPAARARSAAMASIRVPRRSASTDGERRGPASRRVMKRQRISYRGSYVALGASCEHAPVGGVRIAARAGNELGLAYRHRDGALRDKSGDEGPAVALASRERRWLVAQILVPPLPETDQCDVEVKPHARELVVVAILPGAVRDGLEDPLFDQSIEAIGQ